MKLAIDLGVAPSRINTIIDFDAVREYEVKFECDSASNFDPHRGSVLTPAQQSKAPLR